MRIILPNEIVDMVNSDIEFKKILKNNIVKFVRELKKEIEFEMDIVSITVQKLDLFQLLF
ncbi:MAG: hypothetical protein ACLSXJ_07930 [Clostridium saudiense]|uniref:hypothetical protein n=1 Tax=Clostridium saudiense TaxID=1414720 RepID=UPI0018AB0F15|nr:hypothetical protein [Clostridium saudiense]